MASLSETRMLANSLLRKHGLADAGWSFNWDNAKSRGGQCDHTYRRITMSRHLVPMWSDQEVLDTLKHEVAHALVGAGQGHGPVWARKMRELGVKPERCHNNAVVEGRYLAICDHCGVEAHRAHRMSPAMRQGRHLHSVCMKPVRWVDTALTRV